MDMSCILNRRSIRKYTSKAISTEDMQTILKAGMFAPSSHNSQPWEFLVVQNKDTLAKLSEIRPYWKMLPTAAACIVVLANTGKNTEFFAQDCAAATQNILCVANGLGIGSVWLGCYPTEEAPRKVREILNIPKEIIPFALISLGYPDEEKHTHSTYNEGIVHFEKY